MRKTTLLLGAVIAAGLCAGCAGLGGRGKPGPADLLPLGIVAVSSNYNIYWEDEDPRTADPLTAKDDPEKTAASRADTLVTDAEALLRQSFADAGVAAIAPRETVTGSAAYKNARQTWGGGKQWTSVAEGYLPISYGDKKFAAALAAETGVRAGVYVAFDFSKALASGIAKSGTLQVRLTMRAVVVDAAGRTLYKKERFVGSDERLRVTFRKFNREELLDQFRTIIADACDLFVREFAATYSLDQADGDS